MQVYDSNSEKTNDTKEVLDKWRSEFETLYNIPDSENENFDGDFYDDI